MTSQSSTEKYTLEGLMAGITEGNVHPEIPVLSPLSRAATELELAKAIHEAEDQQGRCDEDTRTSSFVKTARALLQKFDVRSRA